MKILLRTCIVAIALYGATFGCGGSEAQVQLVTAVSEDPEAERLFKEGRRLFDAGRYEMAAQAFKSFLKEFVDDPLSGDATVYLARTISLSGDHLAALDLISRLKINNTKSTVALRVEFYKGIFEFRQGRYSAAINSLRPYLGRMTDKTENLLLLNALWRSARALNDKVDMVTWMGMYAGTDPSPKDAETVIGELAKFIEEMTDEDILERLSIDLESDETAWPMVMARMVVLKAKIGDLEAAAEMLARINAEGCDDDPSVVKAADILERGRRVEFDTIGCILPLSGRARLVGEEILKGVMLAAESVRLTDDKTSLSVVIRDSGGLTKRSVTAVEDLVEREHVAGIIGPVDGEVSKVTAARASQLNVPTVLLTMKDNIARVGKSVFRRFASTRAEIAALLDAVEISVGGSYAVLFSDDGYGRAMKDAFSKALFDRKIKLKVAVGFPPSAKDFSKYVAVLADEKPNVLLVAARASQLALIAPALTAEGLRSALPGETFEDNFQSVQLLVPSAGISSDLPRRAGRYLQGALFATNFFESANDVSVDFAARFKDQYGKAPSYYAAFGYDAVLLISAALKAGARDRSQIIRWIADFDVGELVTPLRGFSEEGEAKGGPWILIFRDDNWEILR